MNGMARVRAAEEEKREKNDIHKRRRQLFGCFGQRCIHCCVLFALCIWMKSNQKSLILSCSTLFFLLSSSSSTVRVLRSLVVLNFSSFLLKFKVLLQWYEVVIFWVSVCWGHITYRGSVLLCFIFFFSSPAEAFLRPSASRADECLCQSYEQQKKG